MASEGLRYLLEGAGTPAESQGFSRLLFDLLPNPSIDHLVRVNLKYPHEKSRVGGRV
jgi:hypothetical protein